MWPSAGLCRAYLCAAVEFCWQKEKDSEQKIHKKVRKPNVSSQLERIKLMTEVKNKKSWSNGLTVTMNRVDKQRQRAQQERMKEGEEKLGGPFRGMCPWRFKTLTYRSCGKRRRRGFSTTLLHVSVISHSGWKGQVWSFCCWDKKSTNGHAGRWSNNSSDELRECAVAVCIWIVLPCILLQRFHIVLFFSNGVVISFSDWRLMASRVPMWMSGDKYSRWYSLLTYHA